jgi:hypothetical protein
MPRYRKHPHLYEINTWTWLEELSRRAGHRISLASVPESEWDALAAAGFDFIWLMGVWERSPASRRLFAGDPIWLAQCQRVLPGCSNDDVVGSPYAIRAYRPDPRIGDWAALDALHEKLHRRGIGLILDFVPNHLAIDHPWVHDHPDFFIQGSRGDELRDSASFFAAGTISGRKTIAYGKDPYFPAWRDVAQLNHFDHGLRAALLAQLHQIARLCDGVRCDMAMLDLNDIFQKTWAARLAGAPPLPTEFWADARAALPDFLFFAESYWDTQPRLLELGFDFCYDKNFYDLLRANRAADLRQLLTAPLALQTRLARFLENHDEQRAAALFGSDRSRVAAALLSTVPGMHFFHQGQLEGRKVQSPIALSHIAPEPPDPQIQELYSRLLSITRDDVFHSGAWRLLDVDPLGDDTSANLIVYDWQNEKSWTLVAANPSGRTSQGRMRLGDRPDPSRQYLCHDPLNKVDYERSGAELRDPGLFVRIAPFDAQFFEIAPK